MELDSGKHCIFHNVAGHNTNDCRHLRDLIEGRVRKGELAEYVENRAPAMPPRPSAQAPQAGPQAPRNGKDPETSTRGIIIN